LGAEKHIFLMIFAVLLRKNSYFFVFLCVFSEILHKSAIFLRRGDRREPARALFDCFLAVFMLKYQGGHGVEPFLA